MPPTPAAQLRAHAKTVLGNGWETLLAAACLNQTGGRTDRYDQLTVHEGVGVWYDITNALALQRIVDRVAAFRDRQAAHPAGGAG